MGDVQAVTLGVRRLLLAPLVLLAACGGGEDAVAPSPAPAGLQRVGTSDVSVAVPAGWSVDTRPAKTGRPGEKVTEAIGPEGTDDLPAQLLLGATRNYDLGHTAQVDVNMLSNTTRFEGVRVVSQRKVKVAGAAQATLIETAASNRAAGGTVTPLRLFDLLAISADKTAVALFIRLPAADVAQARVRDILATLEIR